MPINNLASIVYLTKNGGDVFRKSLEATLAQKSTFEFEVIVVDSGSTDGTLEYLKKKPVILKEIKSDEFNFGLTRDYGFSLASGEILITLSQDAVPSDGFWLENICRPFDDRDISVVQGIEKRPTKTDVFYWERIGLFYFTRECRRWVKKYNGIGLSFVNCAIRKSSWLDNKIGFALMSEDKVFHKKMVSADQKIIIQNSAAVFHGHNYNLLTLMNRCENEGLGWRFSENHYHLGDAICDMLNPIIWAAFVFGLCTFQIRSISELLFPVVRPFMLYKGNKSTKTYVS